MAKVQMPSHGEFETYRNVINEKYPLVSDVCSIADGPKLYLEPDGDTIIQNMFYNGWKTESYMKNVFLLVPAEK